MATFDSRDIAPEEASAFLDVSLREPLLDAEGAEAVADNLPAIIAKGIRITSFRKWGKRGGKKRATKLSPKRRQDIARRAALARWRKHPKGESR